MQKRTDIWQTESNMVFKLMETGKYAGGEPELCNQYSMLVQVNPNSHATGPAASVAANFLATQICEVLNRDLDLHPA